MTSVRDLPRVVVTAGRLLARHWPMLLTLAFAGMAVRSAGLWAAVKVSDWNGPVGQMFLVLAPLGYLLPLIAMLHLMRGSLPRVSQVVTSEGPVATTEGRERRLVDVAVSMLVPFLAVYVSYGLLERDRNIFLNQAGAEEFWGSFFSDSEGDLGERLGVHGLQVMVMIVLIAWVVRWALGRLERRTKFLALAFVGALVEVYYTNQVARELQGIEATVRHWVEERQVVALVHTSYDDVVVRLGALAHPIDTVTGWIFSLVGSLDAIVVVPLAWLTVAAVVLGHKLEGPPRAEAKDGGRWQRVPAGVRTTLGSLFGDIRERWSAFWNGLRLLAAAGLVPMLAFCLVFLVALRIPLLISHLVRLLVGPTDTEVWVAFAPWEESFGLALSLVVLAPLLAAALEWLVAARLTAPAGSPSTPAGRTGS